MEMPEKEKKKQQTISVSSKPQEQIRTIVEAFLRLIHSPQVTPLNMFRPPSESPSVDPQKTQRAPPCIIRPTISVRSDSPDSDLQKTQRTIVKASLRALKFFDASEKYNPPSSESPSVDPQKTQRAPPCIIRPTISVRSDSPDSDLQKTQSKGTAPSAASNEIRRCVYQPLLTPPSAPHFIAPPRHYVKSLSVLEPRDSHLPRTQRLIHSPQVTPLNMFRPPSSESPSVDPQKTQRAPPCIIRPTISVRSDSPDSDLQKTQSEPLCEPDSTASTVSVQSVSTRFDPPFFDPTKTQSESLWETDSTDSGVSMRSASSMSEPINFNPHRKQSCSVCEEAVKDPVRLLCGHWSCKLCVHSFWEQYGLTADDPCKKCGRRSEREKRDQDLQSVLLEKTIKRMEVETEKSQAEKEKFELEKRKLALEIQSLEQKGIYNLYVSYSFPHTK